MLEKHSLKAWRQSKPPLGCCLRIPIGRWLGLAERLRSTTQKCHLDAFRIILTLWLWANSQNLGTLVTWQMDLHPPKHGVGVDPSTDLRSGNRPCFKGLLRQGQCFKETEPSPSFFAQETLSTRSGGSSCWHFCPFHLHKPQEVCSKGLFSLFV